MAEFCLECLNRMEHTNATERDYILTDEDDLEFCEGCGEWKRVVICQRDAKWLYDLSTPFRYLRRRLKTRAHRE
ncbi:MAG: hypothetical protein ACI4MF_12795 [Candidatus Faecivicinus sp.]